MSGNYTILSRTVRQFLGGIVFALVPLAGQAEFIDLPPAGGDLVGRLRYVKARQSDTLIDIAHDFSVGQDEIVMANPNVSRWLPGDGTKVLIPDRFILPDAPRVGVVVNIPEMRLYFFPPGEGRDPATQVITYPISVGRMDWKSPMGVTKIVEKIKDPSWTPPESIKKEHAAEGDILPDVVPPGPDNPLGRFAMRLGVKGSYLIHGTGQDKADGIGMMVTHGCMRMYPEDVEQLFPRVSVGTQVNLVNQPVKLGWHGNVLYIEVSQPLEEGHLNYDQLLKLTTSLIQKKTADRPDFVLDGEALKQALEKSNGIPTPISGGAAGAALAAQPEKIPLVARNSRAPVPAPAPVLPAPAPTAKAGETGTNNGSGTSRPVKAQPERVVGQAIHSPAKVQPERASPQASQNPAKTQPARAPVQAGPSPAKTQPARAPLQASPSPVRTQPERAQAQATTTSAKPNQTSQAQPVRAPVRPTVAVQQPAKAAPANVPPGPPAVPAKARSEHQLLPPIY